MLLAPVIPNSRLAPVTYQDGPLLRIANDSLIQRDGFCWSSVRGYGVLIKENRRGWRALDSPPYAFAYNFPCFLSSYSCNPASPAGENHCTWNGVPSSRGGILWRCVWILFTIAVRSWTSPRYHLGIPYAVPPVGDWSLKLPVLTTTLQNDVFHAEDFGFSCLQAV